MGKITPILLMLMWITCGRTYGRDCRTSLKYEVGSVRESSPSKLVQNVSIAREYFSRTDLVCLAKELESRYVMGHDEVDISVFDDRYAAMQRPAIPIEARPKDYEIYQHEHAAYVFKKGTGENYLLLEPDVWNESTHSKIRLDTNQPPNCALQIGQNRCLMVIGTHLRYPETAWRNSERGSVAIQATIAKDGTVTVSTVAGGESVAESLRKAALDDARSWRFEPGQIAELHITYVFQITGIVATYPVETVQYSFPDRVIITASIAR
jgi:TonB family protein